MLKHILATLLLLVTYSTHAQSFSQDSLAAYRTKYIADLYPIIGDDTTYLRFFEGDPAFYVKASVQFLPNQPIVKIPTTGTKIRSARKHARLLFEINGRQEVLYLYKFENIPGQEKMTEMFFLPFYDESNGVTTYEGGRYLDFPLDAIRDGLLYIDFNRAYTGYCAYTTGYNCPIPPKENRIKAVITAGESKFAKKK